MERWLHVELGLGEAVDHALRLDVGVVGAQHVPLGSARAGRGGRRPKPGVWSRRPLGPRGSRVYRVSATRIFAARLVGCSVFDPNGDRVGKVRDVLVVYRTSGAIRRSG